MPYTYDGGGNIIELGNDEFIIYDDVGRLVQVEVNTARRKYEYDEFGNRLKCSHARCGIYWRATNSKAHRIPARST